MHISPNLQVFRVSAAWRRQQTPYRGLDAAVWAVPASVNGSQLTCGPIYAATRLERPSFKGPPEAGAALPRQDPRGCRRSNRRPVRLPVSRSGSRGSNRRSRPVAANGSYRRGSGSCNSGGRMPRERRASSRLGRAVAAQEPGSNRPHHTLGCCTTLVRMLPIAIQLQQGGHGVGERRAIARPTVLPRSASSDRFFLQKSRTINFAGWGVCL